MALESDLGLEVLEELGLDGEQPDSDQEMAEAEESPSKQGSKRGREPSESAGSKSQGKGSTCLGGARVLQLDGSQRGDSSGGRAPPLRAHPRLPTGSGTGQGHSSQHDVAEFLTFLSGKGHFQTPACLGGWHSRRHMHVQVRDRGITWPLCVRS